MPTFEDVVSCVRGERDYQETRWQRPAHNHSLTEYLVFIDHYVKNAMATVSKEDGDKGSLDDFRKIAALAFAAMEENGLKQRKIGDFLDYVDLSGTPVDVTEQKPNWNTGMGCTLQWPSASWKPVDLITPAPTSIPLSVFDPTPPGNIEPRPEPCSCHSILAKDVSPACPVHKEPNISVAKEVCDSIISNWTSYPEHAIATPAEGKIEVITREEGIREAMLAEAKLERGLTNFEELLNTLEDILGLGELLTSIQPKDLDLRSRPFIVDRFYATVDEIERTYPDVDIRSIPVLDPDEANPAGWVSYRARWDAQAGRLALDRHYQTTRALAKTPSPRYVIHKCSRAGCGKHLFFYDDGGVDHLPDAIVDHYLDDHSVFAWAITAGLIPLHTQLTEFVREF